MNKKETLYCLMVVLWFGLLNLWVFHLPLRTLLEITIAGLCVHIWQRLMVVSMLLNYNIMVLDTLNIIGKRLAYFQQQFNRERKKREAL
jgi:hypothetical protein